MSRRVALASVLSVIACGEGAEEWWSIFAQSWSKLPFPQEWSAAVTFHEPGNTGFVDSSMAWSAKDNVIKFRFLRHVPKAWIAPSFEQTYDELLEYRLGSEAAEKEAVHAFAEGQKCHPDGNWDMVVLAGMKVGDETERATLFDGRCDTVLVSRPAGMGNATFCLDSNGAPQELDMWIDPSFSGKTNSREYTISATFHNVTIGDLPADTFAQPRACLEGPPPAACPHDAAEPTEQLTVVHFTGEAGMSCGLNNLMTNGLRGAFAFDGWTGYEYLQVYNVTVHRGFAPIQDCNYHPSEGSMVCTGGDRTPANAKSVGRSSCGYMEGAFAGQCSENPLVGSWYSFPSVGECAEGWDVGYNNCTWKTESFTVISSHCAIEHCNATYQEELRAGRGATDARVVACFEDAIAACPDHRGPMGPTCYSKADVHV